MLEVLQEDYKSSLIFAVGLMIFPTIIGAILHEQTYYKKESCTVYVVDKLTEYLRFGLRNNLLLVFVSLRFLEDSSESSFFYKYCDYSYFLFVFLEGFATLKIVGIIPYQLLPIESCEFFYYQTLVDNKVAFLNKVIWFYQFARLLALGFLWIDVKNHLYIQDHENKKKNLKMSRIIENL